MAKIKNKPMHVEIHAIETLPPSCVNRDDAGMPKSAIYGGTRRARVSSQAWKRAMRDMMPDLAEQADEVGTRTKLLIGLVADEMTRQDPGISRADALAEAGTVVADKKLGLGLTLDEKRPVDDGDGLNYFPLSALFFASPAQVRALARVGVEHANGAIDGSAMKAACLRAASKDAAEAVIPWDIALFGRMSADEPSLNVEAGMSVADAISVTPVDNEFDFYAAVDDEGTGREAAMLGTTSFCAPTLYRYACIDMATLVDSLGSARAAVAATRAAITSFVESMPQGRVHAHANLVLPCAVVISVTSRPLSLAGAFVDGDRAGRLYGDVEVQACDALANEAADIARMYGDPAELRVVSCAAKRHELALAPLATSHDVAPSFAAAVDKICFFLSDRL